MASTPRFVAQSNIRLPGMYGNAWYPHDLTQEIQTLTRVDDAARSKSPLILTILLKGREYDRDLEGHLLTSFHDFPRRLLRRLYESTTDGQGSVVLPSLSDSRSLTFLANYPRIETPTSAGSRHGVRSDTKSGQTPAQFVPALCWCSSVESPFTRTQVGIVVLLAFDERVLSNMRDFWTLPKRQERLSRFEQWAFLDLAVVLSDWPVIWANARRELADLHNSMYSSSNAVIADLGTTRIIHQDMAAIISLREELRLFIAAYAKLRQILRRVFQGDTGVDRVQKLWKNTTTHSPDMVEQDDPSDWAKTVGISRLAKLLDELENRLEDSQTNLEHQLETSEVILRQLENLLGLTFNTQAIAQGQSMATLNLMATIFLPLSFVASIFGMTEFNLSAVWYPLAAFVVLCIVAAALFKLSSVPLHTGSARSSTSGGRRPTFRLLTPTGRSPRVLRKAKPASSLLLNPPGIPPSDAAASTMVLPDEEIIDDTLSLLPITRPQPLTAGVERPGRLGRIFRLPATWTWRRRKTPSTGSPGVFPLAPAGYRPPEPTQTSMFSSSTPYWNMVTGGGVGPQAAEASGRSNISSGTPYYNFVTGGGVGPPGPTSEYDTSSPPPGPGPTQAAPQQQAYYAGPSTSPPTRPQAHVYYPLPPPPPPPLPGVFRIGPFVQPQVGAPSQVEQQAITTTGPSSYLEGPTSYLARYAELPGESSQPVVDTLDTIEEQPEEAEATTPAAGPVKSDSVIQVRDFSAGQQPLQVQPPVDDAAMSPNMNGWSWELPLTRFPPARIDLDPDSESEGG